MVEVDQLIDVTVEERKTLLALVEQHLPDTEVWVYGSRVQWTSRPQSDLDMVVFATPGQEGAVSDLREAFEESDLPFRVDLFVWDEVPDAFQKQIERDHVVLITIDHKKTNYLDRDIVHTNLGDCVHLVRNTVQPSDVSNLPYIGLEHIGQGSLHLEGHGNSNDVGSAKNRFQEGDTLFGKLRPYFRKVVRAPFDGICSTDIWVVRSKNGVDQGFIHYCLASRDFVDFVDLRSEGTRMPRATWKSASEYGIDLPPLPEQRAVAQILRTLDDKIQLNRRMNQTLEAMARAIFRDWFVDFGPVRARIEGRDTGLPKEIADLFPDRLVDSELGETPEGWEVGTMEDGFEIVMGQSPPGRTYNDDGDGLPFFQGCSDFDFRYPKKRKFCTAPKRIAQPWDTMISVRAPVGDINMAWEQCCVGRGVAALRPRSGAVSYGHYAIQGLQAHIREYAADGTVFGAINRKQIAQLPLSQPTPDVIRGFEDLVHPKDKMIRLRTAEVAILTEFRDALLPKLVSGEIRIPDAENLVSELA